MSDNNNPAQFQNKNRKLRTLSAILLLAAICAIPACREPSSPQSQLISDKTLLTVDFQQGQTLKYKFVSKRDLTINWGKMQGPSRKTETRVDKSNESIEMVVAYTPIEVDPYGLTTIQAKCLSVNIFRSEKARKSGQRKDAAETFQGKSWKFTVGPNGKIEDHSEFYELLKQAGSQAIRKDPRQGTIKDPDMIYDVIATQNFLWDAVSSVENVVEGVAVGDEWKSKLSAPAPMILWVARDVNYRLDKIQTTGQRRFAVIKSSFTPTKSVPRAWPVPYSVRFQISGMFGFLRDYKVLDLTGQGQELFNIDKGHTEQYDHNYTLRLEASLPLNLGVNPKITINSTLTMKLLEPAEPRNSQS